MNTGIMGNWSRSVNEHGEYDYDWSQDEADAVVYQHEGKWKLSYSMGYDEEWQQQDLPNATSSDSAIRAMTSFDGTGRFPWTMWLR